MHQKRFALRILLDDRNVWTGNVFNDANAALQVMSNNTRFHGNPFSTGTREEMLHTLGTATPVAHGAANATPINQAPSKIGESPFGYVLIVVVFYDCFYSSMV